MEEFARLPVVGVAHLFLEPVRLFGIAMGPGAVKIISCRLRAVRRSSFGTRLRMAQWSMVELSSLLMLIRRCPVTGF